MSPGNFCNFLETRAFLMPLGLHFARFWSYFKGLKLFEIVKLSSPFSPPPLYLQVKSKTCLKHLYFGLIFLSDLTKERGAKAPSAYPWLQH